MATFTLTDVAVHMDGYDFSTDSNELTLGVEVADNETTTFQSGGYRTRVAGLKDVTLDLSGFWQSDTVAVDPKAFGLLGQTPKVVSVSPTATQGDTAYLFRGGEFSYELFGSIGDATPFSVSVMASDGIGVVRGKTAKSKGTVSATGALGAGLTDLSTDDQVSSTQFLYAALHVFSAGTTITVDLESDDNAGFTTPTTRATFGPLTAAGSSWTRVAGPITDTFYRFNVTTVTGTFTVAGVIAIQ